MHQLCLKQKALSKGGLRMKSWRGFFPIPMVILDCTHKSYKKEEFQAKLIAFLKNSEFRQMNIGDINTTNHPNFGFTGIF